MVRHAVGLKIGSVLSRSFGIWGRNLVPFAILALFIQSPVIAYAILGQVETEFQADLFTVLVNFGPLVLGMVTSAAVAYGVFQQIRGQPVGLVDCLRVGIGRMFPVVGVATLVGLATVIGVFLFIVPGIIVACICYVAVPAAVVERTGVIASIKRSAYLTDGARAAVFGVSIVLGSLTRAVGFIVPFLVPHPEEPAEPDAADWTVEYEVAMAQYAQDSLHAFRIESLAVIGVQAVLGSLLAVASVIVYYDLRVQKEQVDLEQIAEVFA